jgi:hypothetical protein
MPDHTTTTVQSFYKKDGLAEDKRKAADCYFEQQLAEEGPRAVGAPSFPRRKSWALSPSLASRRLHGARRQPQCHRKGPSANASMLCRI